MKSERTRWLAGGALIAYSALLFKLVVFKAIPTIRIGHLIFRLAGTHSGPGNFVPFRTIASQLNGRGNHVWAAANLLGNVIPFLPIGILAPLAFRSFSWRKAVVLGIFTALACELTEAIFRVGIFDVDDLILNACGVLLGYAVFVLLDRRQTPLAEADA